MSNVEYIPRFSFEITEEQKKRSDRLLAVHGVRKAIFSVILDDLLDQIDQNGQLVIGILLERSLRARDVLPCLNEVERSIVPDDRSK